MNPAPVAQLRPVDLARPTGISTQQVRNYVDVGILPLAPRTPSGYRTFDSRHRTALLTYRALARGYGWDTARAITQAVHAALHEQRIEVQAVADALEAVARQRPESSAVPRAGLRIGQLARQLGVRPSACGSGRRPAC